MHLKSLFWVNIVLHLALIPASQQANAPELNNILGSQVPQDILNKARAADRIEQEELVAVKQNDKWVYGQVKSVFSDQAAIKTAANRGYIFRLSDCVRCLPHD